MTKNQHEKDDVLAEGLSSFLYFEGFEWSRDSQPARKGVPRDIVTWMFSRKWQFSSLEGSPGELVCTYIALQVVGSRPML